MGIDDPRLRRSTTAVRNPMSVRTTPVTATLTTVRPVAIYIRANRDPRLRQYFDVNQTLNNIYYF